MLLKSMRSFHFDLGDSGPIGYCAGIIASTPEDGLPGRLPSFPRKVEVTSLREELTLTVYSNPFEVSVDDFDEEDEEEENDPSE
jgi:hypothetical protein